MKLVISLIVIFITSTIIFVSCKKETKCDSSMTVSTKIVQAAVGSSNGKITITSPKGNGYQYSINNGSFQTDTVFANLAIGNYTITAKNGNCIWSATANLANPCTGVTTQVLTTKFDAITGQNNGSISVTQPLGTGVTYSINNGAFQASTNFNNLAAGAYTIKAKTAMGCEGTSTATVNGFGPKYHAVKQLIMGYCGPCHLNGGNSGGANFDTDAQIVAAKNRIKVRAVDNLPTVMPVSGPLTAIDKQKITDWITAGGTTSN
jgi:hypothetical protein